MLRQLALGDGDEVGQAHLGGQQVVEAGVQAPFFDVVANRKQIAALVVQKGKVHVGQVAGQLPQALGAGDALLRAALHGKHLFALGFGPAAAVDGGQLPPARPCGQAVVRVGRQDKARQFVVQVAAMLQQRL